ncbi:MAG: peroxide stress protein YaaA [Thomasclavelia ramosa]
MKIVITPAKRMYQEIDYFDALSKPIYIKESEIILNKLKTLTVNEVKKLLKCNKNFKKCKEAYILSINEFKQQSSTSYVYIKEFNMNKWHHIF